MSLIVSVSVFADGKPNAVLIISDDQAWFDYSFIKPDAPSTPNIDRLAQEGVTFRLPPENVMPLSSFLHRQESRQKTFISTPLDSRFRGNDGILLFGESLTQWSPAP